MVPWGMPEFSTFGSMTIIVPSSRKKWIMHFRTRKFSMGFSCTASWKKAWKQRTCRSCFSQAGALAGR